MTQRGVSEKNTNFACRPLWWMLNITEFGVCRKVETRSFVFSLSKYNYTMCNTRIQKYLGTFFYQHSVQTFMRLQIQHRLGANPNYAKLEPTLAWMKRGVVLSPPSQLFIRALSSYLRGGVDAVVGERRDLLQLELYETREHVLYDAFCLSMKVFSPTVIFAPVP